jgi:hypothetical protein
MMLSASPWRQLSRRSPLPRKEPNSPVHGVSAVKLPRAKVLAQRRRARFHWPCWAVSAVTLLGSLSAQASLGGDVSSIESDRAHMNASVQVMQHDNYDVHEIEVSGTVVDEYVSSQGKVFAVTWHGQFPPPMQQILGTYFRQYSAALQAQPRTYGHRPLNIQEQGLVVQTGGHMRAHFGRAYVPDLLPEGITVSQIQ